MLTRDTADTVLHFYIIKCFNIYNIYIKDSPILWFFRDVKI